MLEAGPQPLQWRVFPLPSFRRSQVREDEHRCCLVVSAFAFLDFSGGHPRGVSPPENFGSMPVHKHKSLGSRFCSVYGKLAGASTALIWFAQQVVGCSGNRKVLRVLDIILLERCAWKPQPLRTCVLIHRIRCWSSWSLRPFPVQNSVIDYLPLSKVWKMNSFFQPFCTLDYHRISQVFPVGVFTWTLYDFLPFSLP